MRISMWSRAAQATASNTKEPPARFLIRKAKPPRLPPKSAPRLGKRGDAGEGAGSQKVQHRAAAGGDEGELVQDVKRLYGGDGVAPADDRIGRALRDSLC